MNAFLPLALLIPLVGISTDVFGQTSTPRSTPTPRPLPNFQTIFDDARRGAIPPGGRGARRSGRNAAEARRQVKREMEPEEAVENEFAGLLDAIDARMVRLHPDFGCEAKRTLSVAGDCGGRVMGASRYEGLHYNNGALVGDAFFALFMIAEIDGVELEDLDSSNAIVKLVAGIDTPEDLAATRSLYQKLKNDGILLNGLHVRDGVEAVEGKTFIIRRVEYKATGLNFDPRLIRSQNSFLFYGLNRNSRRDITAAAKVIRRSPDGIIHLIWRPISQTASPKIRFAKNETPQDFRPVEEANGTKR